MKKSELKNLIREVIKEQLGSAGPRPQSPNKKVAMDKSHVYKNLGSPRTWGEFTKSYARWHNISQPEGPNGEPANDPGEVSNALRSRGENGPIGPQPEERIWPYIAAFTLGYLYAYTQLGGFDCDLDPCCNCPE